MADVISRLRLESGEFDSKIKRAGQELLAYSAHCRKMGLEMGYANRDAKEFARQLGSMATVSQTARGKISELSEAFVNAKVMYKNMTDEEKKGEFGKNLAASLDQLKSRLNSAKQDLADVSKELSGGGKFGEFGNIIDTIGSKFGVSGNLTEMLTSKTAMLTGAVGAGIAIVTKATEAWAGYNAELAKQDQITTVTTGLKGDAADQMTNQARALVDTYNVDFRESINAANTLMTQFGATGEQAMQLIKDGMQGMIQGDGPKLLSMIQQYAPAFRDAGVSASQLVAVIQNSEGGIFTDQNMNAIVMGIKNIRLMTKATSDALAQLGIEGKKMSKQLSDGSLTIFDALKQVAAAVQNVNSNSQAAGEVMQQVFGRQGAMAGTKLGEAIATLNTNLEETKRQTGEVGDAYNDLYEANVKLNGAIRDCFEYDGWDQMATGIKANLVSALASVLDYIGKIKGALGGFSVNQQQGGAQTGGGANMERMIAMLGNGKSQKAQQTYTRQMQEYAAGIFRVNDQIRQIQEKAGQDMDGNMAVVYEKQIRNLENRKQAIQRNMNEYDRRAKAVMNATDTKSAPIANPVTMVKNSKTTTHNATQQKDNLDEEQKVQQKINALLKEAMTADAQRLVDIRQQVDDLQKQQEKYKDIKNIAQGILPKDKEAVFTIDGQLTEEAKKALSDIEGVTVDLKTLTITANTSEALQKVQEMTADIDGTIAEIKVVPVMSDEDVERSIRQRYSKPIEVPVVPKTAGEQLEQSIRIGISDENIEADMETLKTLLETQIKNGIEDVNIPTDELIQKIMGEGINIPDSYWEDLQTQINEKLKELNVAPIKIDFKTGSLAKEGEKTKETWQDAAKAVGSVGNALQQIEDPGVKIAGIVGQAIANIALGFAQATANTPGGIFGWIAAITGGMATMLSTISAIHSATGYAQGGIVDGRGGGFVGGMAYSGDNVGNVRLDSGELVLNRAQQSTLATQLEGGGMQNLRLSAVITGEQIRLVLNNNGRRTGKGEYVQTNFR